MEEKEKDSYIRIRIDAETRQHFANICKSKCINQSELLRALIREWCRHQDTKGLYRQRKTDSENFPKAI